MTVDANHPRRLTRPAAAAVVFWLALWVIVIATWMYDENGFTFGMPGPVFLLMMLGPLLVGLLLGWGKVGAWPAARAGMIGGVMMRGAQ